MLRKIRVLVVDDSTVIRRMLTDAISSDPAIEVAATAANGKIAVAKIPQVNPDVVTLDIEMPEMDGLQTLAEIRRLYPKLPVIMFSTLTSRGAETTLDALALGANDYVTKPANVGSVSIAIQRVKTDLLPILKRVCPWYKSNETPFLPRPRMSSTTTGCSAQRSTHRIDAIAIGVSTGGPNALQQIIPALPAALPVPVYIVQHMPPVFTKHLAQRLNSLSNLEVSEAQQGERAYAGGVWLAPGDYHMTLQRQGANIRLDLNQGTPANSCRPAVDVLFNSVAETYGANVLAILLTGMGQDGARGCEMIRSQGGRVIAQDEATSVVWGMPGAVAQAGLADQVLPLSQIANEIVKQCSFSRHVRSHTSVGA